MEDKEYEIIIDDMIDYIVAEAQKEHLMVDHEAVELLFTLQQEYIYLHAEDVSDT